MFDVSSPLRESSNTYLPTGISEVLVCGPLGGGRLETEKSIAIGCAAEALLAATVPVAS